MTPTQVKRLTASKIRPGTEIRRYAPYTWWLDWQLVTEVEKLPHGRVCITREDGTRIVSAAARFEVREA